MRPSNRVSRSRRVAALLSLSVGIGLSTTIVGAQQPVVATTPAGTQAPAAPGRGGRGPAPLDSRVQVLMHHFAETNEDIPYALFVSSKVKKDKKAPMIVTLHGLGGTHATMMRPNAIDLAEQGGYILLSPMGYNPRGWYGIPATPRRGGPPAAAAPTGAPATPARQGAPRGGALAGANDPPNLRELSEKETLEVVDLVRKEFKVDDNRTYLMGHSMGGAGTYYLAVKYPERWAAIAVLAPAAFGLDPNSMAKIPKTPVMIVHGDMDTAVPVALSRTWADTMKSLKMKVDYIEVPGGDHGTVISSHQAQVFAFFEKHKK
jgi:predicted esterase